MIEDIFHAFSSLDAVEAVALGGSRAGEVFDSKSDYDVYIYCSAPVAEEVRLDILRQHCIRMEIGNRFWEYEDNCTLNDGVDMDIIYRDLDDFVLNLSAVVERAEAKNGYTTCMWHNLSTSKIIFDRNGRLNMVKKRFNIPYPELLRQNIIRRNRRLLSGSLPCYQVQIKKALGRNDMVSINHRISAFLESYFDIIFAFNRQTHPGEKRLVDLAMERCRHLPRDFKENLDRLFAAMFTSPDEVSSCINDMCSAIDAMLMNDWNQPC